MMERMSVQGREISFRRIGSGPPLILLHGYGGSHQDWDIAGVELSNDFTVYLPNFSNHYLDPNVHLSFSDLIEIVGGFISQVAEISDSKVFLAGSSFGAAMAWGVAIKKSNVLSGLALVAPMPPNPEVRMRDVRLKTLLNVAKVPMGVAVVLATPVGKMMLPFLERIFQPPWAKAKREKRLATLTKRKLKVISHSVERFAWIIRNENWIFWESRLSSIQAKTLVLWGEKDHLFKDGESHRLSELIPDSVHKSLPNAGHVMSRENPSQISRLLKGFFFKTEGHEALIIHTS